MSGSLAVEESFDVGRITCQSCERVISTLLSRLDGISGVVADRHTGLVTIRYQPDVIERRRVVAELTDLGYRPRL